MVLCICLAEPELRQVPMHERLTRKNYLERAEECRQLASLLPGEAGVSFLRMAELYEDLAKEPDDQPPPKTR
jgi:hypothetical protein